MSKSGIPIISDVAKLGGKLVKGILPSVPKLDAPAPAPLPERGAEPSAPKIKERAATEFATRESMVQRRAVAAGAQRSDNEADLLGYSPTKRKAASRALLG